MLLITCPYCGARPEIEFRGGGQAHIARPADAGTLADQDWAEFLFYRANPKGMHAERWLHVHGCGRWFNAVRNTASDAFAGSYEIGQPCPITRAEET